MHRACAKAGNWWRTAVIRHVVICKLSTTSSRLAADSLTPATSSSSISGDFARRHIGPSAAKTTAMLEYLELQVRPLVTRPDESHGGEHYRGLGWYLGSGLEY